MGNGIIGLTYSPRDVVEIGGTIVFRSSNIRNGEIDYSDLVRVNMNIKENIITRKGDLLICARNGSPRLIGKNALLTEDEAGQTFGAFMLVYRSSNNPYIHKLLNTKRYVSQVKENLGARINQITTANLNDFEFYFPTNQEESKKVADFIGLLDKRISTQIRVIDKLESLIKGIVVTHFNNVLNKQTITIANLGESYSVGNLSKEDLTTTGEPCILYGELFTTYGCVAHNISSKTKNFEQATLSQKGDLLFPASTTVDAVSLISPTTIQTNGVYVAGDMFGIHIARQYNSEYISYLLNYVYNGKLAKYAQGSTIIHLHYNDIKTATIQVPTLAEQNKCSLLLELFQKKLTAERSLLNMYQVQKNYLLQNMFI